MANAANGIKAKIGALSGRLATVTKAADLLSISREIEALGADLAREERGGELVWPRDLNDATGGEPPKEWGKDPAGSSSGG